MTGIDAHDVDKLLVAKAAAASVPSTSSHDSPISKSNVSASEEEEEDSDADSAEARRRRRRDERKRRRSSRSRSRSRGSSRRTRERSRSKSDNHRRSNVRDSGGRSSGRDRGVDRDRDRDRERERERARERDPTNAMLQVRGSARHRRASPPPIALGPEEAMKRQLKSIDRDQRTVFASQIHPKVTLRAIFVFFSQVGTVRDVQCIQDQRTRKFKGMAYVEMDKVDEVPLALALNGHMLEGYPVSVTLTQAEKNRAAAEAAQAAKALNEQPMRVRVESLHPHVVEKDIEGLFAPFGRIDLVKLDRDMHGKSLENAWVSFRRADEAQLAVTALHGMDLLGRSLAVSMEIPINGALQMDMNGAMSVGMPSVGQTMGASGQLGELDDDAGGGLHMSAQGRAALMQRLQRSVSNPVAQPPPPPRPSPPVVPMIQETTCVVLKNLFLRSEVELDPDLPIDIKEDVAGEAEKHGHLLHIGVDQDSDGHVFLRYTDVNGARAALNSFNGRWFASKQISAEFVVEPAYELRFPDSGRV